MRWLNRKNCLLSMMTVVLAFLFSGIGTNVNADTNGHNRDWAVSWANSLIGNGYDYDGAFGNQCVDIAIWNSGLDVAALTYGHIVIPLINV